MFLFSIAVSITENNFKTNKKPIAGNPAILEKLKVDACNIFDKNDLILGFNRIKYKILNQIIN